VDGRDKPGHDGWVFVTLSERENYLNDKSVISRAAETSNLRPARLDQSAGDNFTRRYRMPVKSTIAVCVFAALALSAATVGPAEARVRHPVSPAGHFSIDNGGMMDSILYGALAANRSYYGTGDPRCPLVRTSDKYGNYTGTIHTCMLPPRLDKGELFSRRLIVGDEAQRAPSWMGHW
jgi:hypothetical protein